MTRLMRTAPLIAALIVAGATLGACSDSSTANPVGPGPVQVVASTDVYGDIAQQVGGAHVAVTSIIHDPQQDPHEYEADARTQLAVSGADIVIENGGGYDDFMGRMLRAAKDSNPQVLNVAEISGLNQHPADGEFNEHLWYDFPTIGKLADRLTAEMSARQPAAAGDFQSANKAFQDQLHGLERQEAKIKAAHAGTGVAITEPVPLYLLQASGLDNKTPRQFSEAVEEGSGVTPAVLRRTTALFSQHTVALLVYNSQTTGPQTTVVVKAAQRADVPVVGVTETLPAGTDYLSWMAANLQRIGEALDQR